MILEKLAESCSERFQSKKSCNRLFCTYKYCQNNCETCLKYVHFPDKAPATRKYDCANMADYYVCKYAYKFTSELYYGLEQCMSIKSKKVLQILSIGCGPCTDILALDLLHQNGIFIYDKIDYNGIDIALKVWKRIYSDIKENLSQEDVLQITSADICTQIDKLNCSDWRPDVIVLQYVFSDMQKCCEESAIANLLTQLGQYIDTCDIGSYIICNDINLNIRNGGGREYFDILEGKITAPIQSRDWHFRNNNKPSHFNYGCEYGDNALIVQPPRLLDAYNPYTSCSSAQKIIKRV